MMQQFKVFFIRILDFLLRKGNLASLNYYHKDSSNKNDYKSDSQKTNYEKAIDKIINSNFHLNRFRRIYNYREIVETVSYQQGRQYLARIERLGSPPASNFSKYFFNDSFGNPIRYRYPGVGKVSPTTLRYISVAMELKRLFGSELMGAFVEIGVGYGGQASILKDFFNISEFGIYDLPDVQKLTKMYLTRVGKSDNLKICSLTDDPIRNWDLVMSNYAFSELPAELQKIYIEKVVSKSKRGYLIMNSGLYNYSGRSDGKLHLAELKSLLPEFEILEEIPNTGPDNYVIVWGHNRVFD